MDDERQQVASQLAQAEADFRQAQRAVWERLPGREGRYAAARRALEAATSAAEALLLADPTARCGAAGEAALGERPARRPS
jgi:hypothetical protein